MALRAGIKSLTMLILSHFDTLPVLDGRRDRQKSMNIALQYADA